MTRNINHKLKNLNETILLDVLHVFSKQVSHYQKGLSKKVGDDVERVYQV